MRELARLLTTRRKDLLRRFEERVRARLPSEAIARPQLLDAIPGFLEALRRSLHDLAEGQEDLAGPGPERPVSEAREAPRFSPGIDLDRLVLEYGVLRECILDLVAEASETVDVQVMRRLDRCLEAFLRDTVAQYERQRNTQHEARERPGREMDRLVSFVLFELFSPLSSLVHMSAMVLQREAPLTEHVQERVQYIRGHGVRVHRVLRDLQDLVCLTSGIRRLEPEPTDLGQLCDISLMELRMNFPEQPFRLEAAGAIHGMWDSRRLFRLLDALIRLAFACSPTRTPMTVALREERDRIRIDVGNVGELLRAEPLPELVDIVRVVGRPCGSVVDMPALAFHMAQHITSAHGGTIEVRASRRAGTVFTVWLPRTDTGHRPPA